MIIIASKEGQFANRVIHFANFYAFAKTYNVKLVHLCFQDYSQYFPNLKKEKNIYCLKASYCSKLVLKCAKALIGLLARGKSNKLGFIELISDTRTLPGESIIDINTDALIKKCKKKIVFFQGWLFRDPINFKLKSSEIKRLFALPEIYESGAVNIINNLKRKFDIIIGVHIRRGDYKTFENGRWYYEDDLYNNKLETLNAELRKQDKKVIFLICSNETVNTLNFNVPMKTYEKGFIVDFLLLTMCDYLIGPPSTFSALASFYGANPIFYILTKPDLPELTAFKVVENL